MHGARRLGDSANGRSGPEQAIRRVGPEGAQRLIKVLRKHGAIMDEPPHKYPTSSTRIMYKLPPYLEYPQLRAEHLGTTRIFSDSMCRASARAQTLFHFCASGRRQTRASGRRASAPSLASHDPCDDARRVQGGY